MHPSGALQSYFEGCHIIRRALLKYRVYNIQVERIAGVVGDLDVEGPGGGGAAVAERHRTRPGTPLMLWKLPSMSTI